MHLFDPFFRCTNSSTIFGGLIHQGGEMKYDGVSKMSESSMLEAVKNCLIRRPKVRITFGLASNNFIYLLSNSALCAGCFGIDFIEINRISHKEIFYLTTHSTRFIYGYMASDVWYGTTQIMREETRCHHMGYAFRVAARVLASSHKPA